MSYKSNIGRKAMEVQKFIQKAKNLPHLKNHKEIIDSAFSKASKISTKDAKQLSANKINSVSNTIVHQLEKIDGEFNLDFPDYYREITNEFFPHEEIDNVFEELRWLRKFIKKLEKDHMKKLKKINKNKINNRSEYYHQSNVVRKKFYGRINSLLDSKKYCFEILRNYRKFLRSLPKIMPMYTVSLAGYPNVGKSSFLSKLTGSNSEVANYAFTTKKVMMGYRKIKEGRTAQIIDCPGTLDRNVESMNEIERQSIITLRSATDLLIFMIDPSYDLKKQINLLNYINEKIRIVDYVLINKIDLFNNDVISGIIEMVESESKINKVNIYSISVKDETNLDKIKKLIDNETLKFYKENTGDLKKQ